MPIRRSALSALCLVIFGTAAIQAQENDPFSEWDRQAKRPAAKSTAKPVKSSVTYFSPAADSAAETNTLSDEDTKKASAMQVAQTRMRERNGTAPAVKKPATAKSATEHGGIVAESSHAPLANKKTGNVKPAVETKIVSSARKPMQPATLTKNSDAVIHAPAMPTADVDTFVQPAALKVKDAHVAEKSIVQVSQSEEEMSEPSEDANPFADFLNASGDAGTVAKTTQPDEPDYSGEEAEHAEALFPPKSGVPKATPAQATVPANAPVSSVPQAKKTAKQVSVTKQLPASKAVAKADHVESVDEGPQSPGVTVQWVRRGDFNVGQECDVDLIVQNTSKATIRSVTTEAVIPAAVEVLESNPPAEEGADSPTWTFGELKPGETRTVSMKMIPRERGGVRLDALVRLTGSSSTEFSVQEPMLAAEVSGPETVEVGEQVGFVVRVNNPGTGLASNVIIQAAVPDGLEHRSGRILSIEIGTLNPGESRQAKLSLTAVKGGDYKLAVRAIADGELNAETVADLMIAEPQLNIAIAGPQEQMTGRTTDFTMSVSNAGNVQSANVRAKYRVPEGLEFISADRGGKYNKADHSIEWFVGTLQPDETSDFQLSLRATQTGELTHQAGVISEHGQVTLCDYATTVEGMAALKLEIVASDKTLAKGEKVTWEVRIRNTGTRPAVNVGMSCEMPSGIELIHADGPTQHIAENGIMVFRSLPVIQPSEEIVYTIEANCVRTGTHRLRMRVASESIAEPLIGEEAATVNDR